MALVAGATRGAGRGIAAALGEAGATVICTGRSSRTGALTSDYDRPETIEETAELVTRLGGVGIAEVVDHLDPEQVARLAERVRDEHGHLDVLVNDIWGGEVLKGGPAQWNTPIWEHDLDDGLRILRLAIDTHLITSHHLLPLLDRAARRPARRGHRRHHRLQRDAATASPSFYDLAKVAVNRLAFSQGHELAPHGGTAVAVTPGWLRSEMMLEAFGVTEETWRDALATQRPRPPASRSRSHRATWAARWPRWPPTPTGRAGTSSRSAPPPSRPSTASPTSTAPNPTPGA